MEEEKRKAYSEVVEVLKLIENEKKIEQIPFEVIQLIKANSDPTYKPNISKEIPLEEQNLKDETYSILGWIASKYWGEKVEIKEEITTMAQQENQITETQKETKQDKIETSETEENNEKVISVYNDIEPQCLEGSNLPVLITENTWYQKLKAKVISILKKIFKIKNKKEEGDNE